MKTTISVFPEPWAVFDIMLIFLFPEAAVDRQIAFPLSPAHNIEVERNGKPGLAEFSEEMQYMDVEEPQCKFYWSCYTSLKIGLCFFLV